MESLIASQGEHSILAQLSEEAMSFQDVQLREGRGPIINQAQLIRAVANNMKQLRLVTTVSNRAGAQSVGGSWAFAPHNIKTLHSIFDICFAETFKE